MTSERQILPQVTTRAELNRQKANIRAMALAGNQTQLEADIAQNGTWIDRAKKAAAPNAEDRGIVKTQEILLQHTSDQKEQNIVVKNVSMKRLQRLIEAQGPEAFPSYLEALKRGSKDPVADTVDSIQREYYSWCLNRVGGLHTQAAEIEESKKYDLARETFVKELRDEAETALKAAPEDFEIFSYHLNDHIDNQRARLLSKQNAAFPVKEPVYSEIPEFPQKINPYELSLSELVVLLGLYEAALGVGSKGIKEFSNPQGRDVLLRLTILPQLIRVLKENGNNLADINIESIVNRYLVVPEKPKLVTRLLNRMKSLFVKPTQSSTVH